MKKKIYRQNSIDLAYSDMSVEEYINADIEASDSVVTRADSCFLQDFDKKNDFNLKNRSRKYDGQFYSMYQYRLSVLKTSVDNNAMKKWGNGTKKVDGQYVIKKDKILDISSGELCWVSGTIYSDLKNKLNILHDVDNGVDDILPKPPKTYTVSDSDEMPVVMLEDESGRAVLNNDEFLKRNILVTGCIVAVLGIEIQAGIFEIMDVVYPSASPQRPLKAPANENSKIALVSGLNITDEPHFDIKLELLKQYLSGELGSNSDTNGISKVSQLIIAGDSIAPIEEKVDEDFFTTNNYGSKNISRYNTESLKNLNDFINDLLPSIPIALMPGNNDPAEICLPQQPLHRSVYQSNKQYVGGRSLHNLTNPAWLEMKDTGLRMLGTSGQNVDDILRYLTPETLRDPEVILTVMESNIKWQNIIPTAPDTVYCYPFEDSDPFSLYNETPHVYFAGNQTHYHSKTIRLQRNHDTQEQIDVNLISIPDFRATGQIVLFDLDTRTCELVTIST